MRMKIKDWVYGGPCEVSIWVRLNTRYMPPFLATSIRNMIIFDQLFSHMSDSVPHLQVGLWTHLPSSIYLAQTSTNSAVDLCIVKTKLPTEKCVQNLPKNRGWWRRFARNSSTRHESLPSKRVEAHEANDIFQQNGSWRNLYPAARPPKKRRTWWGWPL